MRKLVYNTQVEEGLVLGVAHATALAQMRRAVC